MDQPKNRPAHARSAVQRLEETLGELLAEDYPPDAVAELMMTQATSLFAGLAEADCRRIVSHILETAAPASRHVERRPGAALRDPTLRDNVIPFPARRVHRDR